MASVDTTDTLDKENLDIEGDLSENLKKEESSSEKEELAIDETTEVKEPEDYNPIITGKRQRTTVKAFTSGAPPKEKKELEFEVGNGVLLGDIDIVTEYMDKTVAEQYVILHRILYNVVGTQPMRKRNIRRFNGFNFEKDSKEYDSKLASIKRLKSVDRKNAMKLLGLYQSVTIDEMMDFLMCPADSKRHAPSKRKSKTPAKKKRSSSKGEDVDDKSKNGTKKKASKAKQTKATPKKSKDTPAKTPKRKRAVPTKKGTDEEVDSSLSDSASGSEEEEEEKIPTPKKRKLSESITDISKDDSFTGPSDEEIVTAIKKTVEGIDLEEVSMKQAVAKVNGMFPSDDLSSRKSFIKEKIREFIG